MVTHPLSHHFRPCSLTVALLLCLFLWPGTVAANSIAIQSNPFIKKTDAKSDISSIKKGTFLVATKKLSGSSFSKTVILLTHYSNRGATGIAINRPANMRLNEAYPDIEELKDNKSELYLGGPVRGDALFILTQTKNPQEGMRNIADDLYFAPGIKAFGKGSGNESGLSEQTRAYAGYSGWAPGQLENEIRRGDWLVVQSKLDIVFDQDIGSIWKTLTKSWSGKWI